MEESVKIIAVAGKGGVGKTSLAGTIVKLSRTVSGEADFSH